MTQKEIENILEGMWQNLKSNYLWIFYPSSDGQRKGIVADNNRPVGGRSFDYEINMIDDENIIIDLITAWCKDDNGKGFIAAAFW